jgi:6-pyruvoyltetrahydropterin/6-carboxytetrahydropterin synthase
MALEFANPQNDRNSVMQRLTITRRLEFDAGHRIPNHGGQCRHLHGHRYTLELTVLGPVHPFRGQADDGMVIDFGDIKRIALTYLVEPWDHAFLVAKQDKILLEFLKSLPNHKTVVLDDVPTVENLVKFAFDILAPIFVSETKGQLALHSVRLYETPNCWADYQVEGNPKA